MGLAGIPFSGFAVSSPIRRRSSVQYPVPFDGIKGMPGPHWEHPLKTLFLASLTACSAAAAALPGHLGLQLYSLREIAAHPGWEAQLAEAKALGFDLVEGGSPPPGVTAEEYKAALARRGLRMNSMHFGYDRLSQDLAGAVAEARALGVHGGGDPVQLLRAYRARWALMHVKDIRRGAAVAAHRQGAGQVDWPGVLREAAAVGVQWYYIEDESNSPLVNIPASQAFLRSVAP